jgi:transposase InsO family protein
LGNASCSGLALSNTLTADPCVEALEEAILKYGPPEIMNTDQGSQFTSSAFIGVLEQNAIQISMDGKGCWRDNVFVERLWKSVKYEEVYLHGYDTVSAARQALSRISISTTAVARIQRLTEKRPTWLTSTSASRRSPRRLKTR